MEVGRSDTAKVEGETPDHEAENFNIGDLFLQEGSSGDPVPGVDILDKPSIGQVTPASDSQEFWKSCFYVKAKVGRVQGSFLVDTGSSISVLSNKVVSLTGLECNTSPVDTKICVANGHELKVQGKCDIEIELEHLNFAQSFVIAEIEGNFGILGMDFLQDYDCSIMIGKRILKTSLGKLKLCKQRIGICAKIVMEDKIEIPARSEVFVKGFTDRICPGKVGLVEPSAEYSDRGLLVGRTLVDNFKGEAVVPVMNISDKPIKIHGGVSLGKIHQVSSVSSEGDTSDLGKGVNPVDTSLKGELPDHLRNLVDESSANLCTGEKEKLQCLIHEFQDIFVGPDGQLGQTNLAEHFIDTGDAKPFKLPARRIPMFKMPVVNKELDRMLENDVIEPSSSPWNSPICLVTKPDGSCRFCIDLRALNAVTRLDAYPLPRCDETLDQLAGSKFFCTLDLASGYWQLKLSERDREKTAFRIPGRGHFQFKVTCFGLKNAAGSFERLMEIVLQGLKYEKCLVYLDDVIVKGKTFDETLSNLRDVFLRFRQANLRLKPKKCKLFRERVVFLGHLVSAQGITCNPAKVEVIKEWPRPQSRIQIRQFIGLINYYRKMIPFCADRVRPLTRLTKKGVKFDWGPEQEASFNDLKNCLMESPILGFPERNGGSLVLDTDASGFGAGAILSQIQDGKEVVLSYASHALNPAQQNYCTTKRELYAVVYFLQHFKHYLLNRKFILRTDHAPLKWLCSFREPEGILARWLSIV
ncbi:MAG: retroviral-like aspartic protease family protein, partial [Candidatus Thiodiazotropha taylori]|nr:retroviral-like aspartic protease family protein [Candidatus Thiodiazotropha taylori]